MQALYATKRILLFTSTISFSKSSPVIFFINWKALLSFFLMKENIEPSYFI